MVVVVLIVAVVLVTRKFCKNDESSCVSERDLCCFMTFLCVEKVHLFHHINNNSYCDYHLQVDILRQLCYAE